MSAIVIVLTTVGREFDAHALATALVESRTAACVNIGEGLMSVYRWEGRVVSDTEQLLVIKTAVDRVDALREALMAVHPYQLPEFVVIPVRSSSAAYEAWILESVSPH